MLFSKEGTFSSLEIVTKFNWFHTILKLCLLFCENILYFFICFSVQKNADDSSSEESDSEDTTPTTKPVAGATAKGKDSTSDSSSDEDDVSNLTVALFLTHLLFGHCQ